MGGEENKPKAAPKKKAGFQSLFIVEWAVKLYERRGAANIPEFQSLFIVEWAVKNIVDDTISYIEGFQSLFIVEWAVKCFDDDFEAVWIASFNPYSLWNGRWSNQEA